jgi:uncharacterized lipoprotein YajG
MIAIVRWTCLVAAVVMIAGCSGKQYEQPAAPAAPSLKGAQVETVQNR